MKQGSCMVHDKQTCLLLVQMIEICAGRVDEAASLINNKNSDQLVQLTRSICDSLNYKMLLSQVTYIKVILFSPFVHRYTMIYVILSFQEKNTKCNCVVPNSHG